MRGHKNKKKRETDEGSTSPTEVEELIRRIEAGTISEGDRNLVVRLLRLMLVVQHSLKGKQATLLKLKQLIFGKGSDKQSNQSGNDDSTGDEKKAESESNKQGDQAEGQQEVDRSGEDGSPGNTTAEAEPEEAKATGHGRLSESAYKSAITVECRHEGLRPGSICPHRGCRGRLYDTNDPQIFIRLEGNPVVEATRYKQQVLRCSGCQDRFGAGLPAGVAPEKYDATADASIALMKYGAGMPWYRLARVQKLLGVPLPMSTQFERCATVADVLGPVYRQMQVEAATGEVWQADDTSIKILSCLKENQGRSEKERQGLHTSGMVAQVGLKQIALYCSGRRHAGENLQELARLRPPQLGPPIVMADAEAKNWVGDFKKIVAKCMQHGRRKFTEVEMNFPVECRYVLDELARVYKNEAETRSMSSSQRLAHHQNKSMPILNNLRKWIQQQLDERQVEPNSGLGQAMRYMLTHWSGLIAFTEIEGAPIDNNLVERILKLVVLGRKNFLFYKTERGARIGDILTSVIQTCALNKVNPFDYLVKVIRGAGEVSRDPAGWLPWKFQGEPG